jgi:ubiquinone/menaquinone biosynthesis C-methylase UbiE
MTTSTQLPPTDSLQRKPYGGLQMEGPIARWYARITRDRTDHRTDAQAIAAQLAPRSAVLEVAPGPGFTAIELARLGDYAITGLDISQSFVRIATDNATRAGVNIDFRRGDVTRMPFPDESFDFAVCKAAFKNFPDPVAALNQIHRVLRTGGRASIFDLRKDAPREAIDREIRGMHVSRLNAFLMRLVFRFGLLRAAYTRGALLSVVARSRFGHGELITDGIGFELRLVKAKPS